MPKARNRWERATQVLRWLSEEFDLPDDLRLEIVDRIGDDDLGETDEVGGRLVIRLSAAMCRSVNEAVETAIHEAAHAWLWPTSKGHFHGPTFWSHYGEMMDAFDHHGHDDSRSYPVE